MNKTKADKIREAIGQKKASGEMIPSRVMIIPIDEIQLLKYRLCTPFVEYQNRVCSTMTNDEIAESLGINLRLFLHLVNYYIDQLDIGQQISLLVKLAEVDGETKKTIGRMSKSIAS